MPGMIAEHSRTRRLLDNAPRCRSRSDGRSREEEAVEAADSCPRAGRPDGPGAGNHSLNRRCQIDLGGCICDAIGPGCRGQPCLPRPWPDTTFTTAGTTVVKLATATAASFVGPRQPGLSSLSSTSPPVLAKPLLATPNVWDGYQPWCGWHHKHLHGDCDCYKQERLPRRTAATRAADTSRLTNWLRFRVTRKKVPPNSWFECQIRALGSCRSISYHGLGGWNDRCQSFQH